MCNLSEGIFNKGFAAGYAEGWAKRAKEIAHRLQGTGMSTEEIAEIVDFSPDEVRQWLADS